MQLRKGHTSPTTQPLCRTPTKEYIMDLIIAQLNALSFNGSAIFDGPKGPEQPIEVTRLMDDEATYWLVEELDGDMEQPFLHVSDLVGWMFNQEVA